VIAVVAAIAIAAFGILERRSHEANSPPDSLANGDTVRAAGEFSGSNENLGRAGGETAAASEPKEH
jgi:hypothetical protein